MKDVLKIILMEIPFIIDLIGMMILILGCTRFLGSFIHWETSQSALKSKKEGLNNIRNNLGTYLLIGLEFMIASDIINTILDPSREELIELGVIVLIRTMISYFLNREISENEASKVLTE